MLGGSDHAPVRGPPTSPFDRVLHAIVSVVVLPELGAFTSRHRFSVYRVLN
jgi:hypothetical protein